MKRIIYLLIALLLAVSVVTVFAVAEDDSGSPKHIPRVVSIVFDDSGSMFLGAGSEGYTDRWAYASYAMQTFVAMMDPEDVLHVTYISNTLPHDEADLSIAEKQSTVEHFAKTQFGGGTKNKLREAADLLVEEYGKYGNDAIYYYVVMADGVLDIGQGDFATDLPREVSSLEKALEGAEFDAIFFSMGQKINVGNVRTSVATTSDEIVRELQTVSTEIMGRTDVTDGCKMSDGLLSLELKYPALSVTVFAQKPDGSFENASLSMKSNGKATGYDVNTYGVACPEELTKSYVKPARLIDYPGDDEKGVDPQNPPRGFVSIITNGDKPIPKGSYSIDLSKYDLKKSDLIVLVEPAVKIGCVYMVGDEEYSSFSDIKEHLKDGDEIVVSCGLYEMTPDGKLGDKVPSDVLSPNYKLYINGNEITAKKNNKQDSFVFTVDPEYADKELKIEARLEGYQPFVKRESFGKISTKLEFDVDDIDFKSRETITKKNWQAWVDGDIALEYPLKEADGATLSRLDIMIQGYNGIKGGKCTELDVTLYGNKVVFKPDVIKGQEFSALPDSFAVSLLADGKELAIIVVSVIRPQYKLTTKNELEGKTLSADLLTDNDKSVVFTLTADYDGKGFEKPIENISFELDCGKLKGDTDEEDASISFTPRFDPNKDSLADILGSEHKVSVRAFADGEEVTAATVSFSVSNAAYKLTVDNPISEAFTLDSIKSNTQRITFTVLADYTGSGSFGSLADWDSGAYERLTVTSGKLPGKFETLYDAGGKAVGKSFTPIYDENNGNGVVFTEVAGRVHTVKATLDSLEAETTVEVALPVFDVLVKKEGLELVETELKGNTNGVEFEVLRDGRPLNARELEGLAPYEVSVEKSAKRIKLTATVKTDADGSAYLSVVPSFKGWRFISSALWEWLLPFQIRNGENTVEYTLGDKSATAGFLITPDTVAGIIGVIIIAILLFINWWRTCVQTHMRFEKGTFYTIDFKSSNGKYKCNGVKRRHKAAIWKGMQMLFTLRPAKHYEEKHTLEGKSIIFSTQNLARATGMFALVFISPILSDVVLLLYSVKSGSTFYIETYPYCISPCGLVYADNSNISKICVKKSADENEIPSLEGGTLMSPNKGNKPLPVKMELNRYIIVPKPNSKDVSVITYLLESDKKKIKKQLKKQK